MIIIKCPSLVGFTVDDTVKPPVKFISGSDHTEC